MRVVAPLLAMKVYGWIAASRFAPLIGRLALAILALKALVPAQASISVPSTVK
jgi:hypothetical protein